MVPLCVMGVVKIVENKTKEMESLEIFIFEMSTATKQLKSDIPSS